MQRISIKKRTSTGKDSYGSEQYVWSTHIRTWARVSPLSGTEQERFRQDKAMATTEFKMRHIKNIVPDMVIEYGGKDYNISEVIDTDAGRTELVILGFADAS